MAKLILSPLFITMALLAVIIAFSTWRSFLVVRWEKETRRYLWPLFPLLLLYLTSIPVCTDWLFSESLRVQTPVTAPVSFDAIVVLGAGHVLGPSPEQDHLIAETVLRVMGGVRTWQRQKSGWLVLSGGSSRPPANRQAQLMRQLAVKLGVPRENLIMEGQSRNTRDHPLYVSRLPEFNPQKTIAVVTSPWHLRRAMREFVKFFPRSIPMTAYPISDRRSKTTWRDWLPNIWVLKNFTLFFQEHIGYLWYRLLDQWES
jgi:uncharacterized SAM-binding protein YcdF (DUF218 family)